MNQEKESLQMDSTKPTGKTIGEVEKLTGIPKRKLKYMIERNLMRPSQRAEAGFWLYSEEDIQIVQTVVLFQHLDFTEKGIRALLATPSSQWPEALERQITHLTEKKDCVEDQLFLAELLRHRGCILSDAVAFSTGGNSVPHTWKTGEKSVFCRFLCQIFSEAEPETPLRELSRLVDRSPDEPAIQAQIQQLCDQFRQRNALSPSQLLLILRIAQTLSGLTPVLDALLSAEGATQFITAAMQHYCEH